MPHDIKHKVLVVHCESYISMRFLRKLVKKYMHLMQHAMIVYEIEEENSKEELKKKSTQFI